MRLLDGGKAVGQVRASDFLVITRSNKLLFASFAGCFPGLKRIAYGRDDGITSRPRHVPAGSPLAEDERRIGCEIKTGVDWC